MPTNQKSDIKFIDFCAGIGAGRLGLQNLGLSCIGFSEIDKYSERTYREFFGQEEKNHGDLMKVDTADLPDFDLMIAGFPCQSFSVIGQRKGMNDHRGQIIYGLIKIMNAKNLPYFILENVKGLVNHEGGKTLKVISVHEIFSYTDKIDSFAHLRNAVIQTIQNSVINFISRFV